VFGEYVFDHLVGQFVAGFKSTARGNDYQREKHAHPLQESVHERSLISWNFYFGFSDPIQYTSRCHLLV
jgi:hypothetical protein